MQIAGYQLLEEIGESEKTVLYRARRASDGKNVIIKTTSQPAFFKNFTREYETARILNIEGVVKIECLEEYDGGLALIMEDFGGVSLKKIILARVLTLKEQLAVAVKLADILGRLHACQVIHGDIKPSNIIVNIPTGEVRIADLGDSRLGGTDNPLNTASLLGTLAYMSPEQTGRMNRLPDYRTDFYSLGITLYELFSGEPPFRSAEPIEMIYWHIAKTARPLASLDEQFPAVLSAIVDKLLAKNPEDRYQSAYGIKYDLEKCQSLLERQNRIPAFAIARKDVSEFLNIPHKIYGRQREKEELRQAYERVACGKSELVLIHGPAGTGKTTLVGETFRGAISQGAFFVEGKFDQIGQGIPYSAIIKALGGLVAQLLTQSREKLAVWKNNLQAAVGVNGRVILDVIPEVELIIGGQPELPVCGPVEAQNIFDFVFQEFFKVFTRQEHPLVIFLDDLQFADAASLRLMELVLTEAESRHFLLAGAYRDSDAGADHPLLAMFASVGKASVRTQNFALGPLGKEEITALLSDMLSRTHRDVGPLATLVRKKTGGNAFFVNQFLDKIHREKLLSFDVRQGCWQWDQAAIGQMSVTENVTDLLIDRLNTMPQELRSVMSLAACIGNTFQPALLAEVLQLPPREVARRLATAVQEGFLLPVRGLSLADGTPAETGILRFLHDRIQETSYTLLGPGEARQAHLAIGRALLARTSPETLDENIFEILSHLLKGVWPGLPEKERLEIARLALKAGGKAKSTTAYDQACTYLAAGMALATKDIWQTDYPFAFALHRERSECEYLAGNHERAQKMFELTFRKAQSNLDRAEIYRIRMALDAKMGKFMEHQSLCIEAIKLFGIHLPDLADREAQEGLIDAEIQKLNRVLETIRISDLTNLPLIDDPEKIACQRLLMDALSSAYVSNPTFFAMGTVTLVNITLKYGVNKDSNYTFVVWGMLLCIKYRQYERAVELGNVARKLNERFQSKSNRCMVPFVIGNFLNHWRRHVRYNMDCLREAFQAGREIGDFVYGSFSAMSITRVALSYGHDHLDSVLEDVEASLAFFKRIKNYPAQERQEMVRQAVLNLLGLTPSPSSFNSDTFDEQRHLERMEALQYGTGIALFHLYKAQTLYLAEDFAGALAMSRQAVQKIAFMTSMMQESDCLLFHCLIMTALYPGAAAADREGYDQELQKSQQTAKVWRDNCPENFLGRYLLVEAELARVRGDFRRACRLFDKAIQAAEDNGFIFLAALASELAAKCYLDYKTPRAARSYLEDAVRFYRAWGAGAKAAALENKYRQLVRPRPEGRPGEAKTSPADTPPSSGLLTNMIDLTSIIKSSQAISGEIHFQLLIEKLMNILIENAGAQNGYLCINQGDTLCISARKSAGAGPVEVGPPVCFDEAAGEGPYSVIQYVQRTAERIVLNDAADKGLFTADPYIAAHRPRSILCMPIVEQAKTVGILYLENRVLRDTFTPERINILELLSSQAAISIRNALYLEEINRTKEELQESKEKLQKSFDEYSNLFENIQDVFYRTDLEGNLTLVSPSFEKLLGYPIKEIPGMKLQDIYRYPGQRRLLELQLLEEGYIENFETQLRKKDGTYIWASANSHLLRDGAGNASGVEGMMRDITIRKQAENKVRESEEKYRGILDNMDDSYYEVDPQGNYVFFNEAMIESTGYSREELKGMNYRQLVSPESYRHVQENFRNVSRTGRTVRFLEYDVVRKDGRRINVESWVSPILDQTGRPAGYKGMATDVTERRQAQEMSRQSEEKFMKVFMTAPDCIAITRLADGQLLEVNLGFEAITGWQRNEVLGRTSFAIGFWVQPADRHFLVEELQNGRDVRNREFQFRRRDGALRDGNYSARPFDVAGEKCLIFILQDITEKKQLEEESLQLKERLNRTQKLEAIGTLAGGIAHDFNNILSAIVGYAEMTKFKTTDETIGRYLEQILKACDRCRDLVKQILTFSRQQKQEKQTMSVSQIAREALKLLRSSIPATIEINQQYLAANDTVWADPTQIHQVLMNLCTNAVQAMPGQHGLLEVILREREFSAADRAAHPDLREDSYLELSVRDSGEGIDPAIRDRIFDPFFTTKKLAEGTGLGLSVVYGIIKDCEGTITVDSEPGRGTVFTIYLPLVRADITAHRQPVASIPRGQGRILYVDDEESIAEMGSELLATLGYEVTVCPSSRDALARFRANPQLFDLVITDMTMPQMTGAALALELLKIRPELAIILTTGFSEMIDEEEAKKIGIREFLMKPVSLESMAQAVRRNIKQPSG